MLQPPKKWWWEQCVTLELGHPRLNWGKWTIFGLLETFSLWIQMKFSAWVRNAPIEWCALWGRISSELLISCLIMTLRHLLLCFYFAEFQAVNSKCSTFHRVVSDNARKRRLGSKLAVDCCVFHVSILSGRGTCAPPMLSLTWRSSLQAVSHGPEVIPRERPVLKRTSKPRDLFINATFFQHLFWNILDLCHYLCIATLIDREYQREEYCDVSLKRSCFYFQMPFALPCNVMHVKCIFLFACNNKQIYWNFFIVTCCMTKQTRVPRISMQMPTMWVTVDFIFKVTTKVWNALVKDVKIVHLNHKIIICPLKSIHYLNCLFHNIFILYNKSMT